MNCGGPLGAAKASAELDIVESAAMRTKVKTMMDTLRAIAALRKSPTNGQRQVDALGNLWALKAIAEDDADRVALSIVTSAFREAGVNHNVNRS